MRGLFSTSDYIGRNEVAILVIQLEEIRVALVTMSKVSKSAELSAKIEQFDEVLEHIREYLSADLNPTHIKP